MKKELLSALLLSIALQSSSQNTFPSSGNVGIGTTTPGTPLQVNGSSNDIITAYGSGSGRAGIYVQNTNPAGMVSLITDNNRGSFASYCGIFTGCSTTTYPPLFGLSRADRGFLLADGASNLGLGIGTLTAQPLVFGTNNAEQMRLDASGNLLLGTQTALEKLSISGNALADKFRLNNISIAGAGAGIFAPSALTFAVYTNSNERMRVDGNGQVGIGTVSINDVNFKLFVETGIRTRKIKVDQTAWPDYVFRPAYPLLPIRELDLFIATHGNLPGIPSAEQVEKDGIDLGENQAVLLKKVEELTLYILEKKKKQYKEYNIESKKLASLVRDMQKLKKFINK
jgi:hypothetical protein